MLEVLSLCLVPSEVSPAPVAAVTGCVPVTPQLTRWAHTVLQGHASVNVTCHFHSAVPGRCELGTSTRECRHIPHIPVFHWLPRPLTLPIYPEPLLAPHCAQDRDQLLTVAYGPADLASFLASSCSVSPLPCLLSHCDLVQTPRRCPVHVPSPLLGMSSLPLPGYLCSSFRSQDQMKPSWSFPDRSYPQTRSGSPTFRDPGLSSAQINFMLILTSFCFLHQTPF